MEIFLRRIKQTKISTLGELTVGDIKVYTLEDGYNFPKIYAETRIDSGRYEIKKRLIGSFYEEYKDKFGKDHFILWLQNVPNFELILIHIGNFITNTKGCILVGEEYSLVDGEEYQIWKSKIAYLKIWPLIAEALNHGEKVYINITEEWE